ncbi:MAG: SDR family oxidoreductase [Phycisphaerae bacterium]|nr:SDR family oxidoreductase [Phycisphaerae bacterium]
MNQRRKALVTGASSGIGRATAVRLAADGYDVCLNARRLPLLEEIAAGLAPGNHLVCAGDYSDASVVDGMAETLGKRWERLDVLVNSAGVFMPVDALDSSLPEWRRPFDILFEGGVRVTRMAAGLMSEGGRIIHITSVHGQRAEAKASSYSMAKAALEQYCRSLAVDLADRGILVNAIAPGFVRTAMSVLPDGTDELETEWFLRNYVEGHHLPLRRPAEPEEIAGVASFLAGPDATYITGHVITVDGGLTITF